MKKIELKNEVERLTRRLSQITIEKDIIEWKLLLAKDNLKKGMLENVTDGDVILDQFKGQINPRISLKQPEISDLLKSSIQNQVRKNVER